PIYRPRPRRARARLPPPGAPPPVGPGDAPGPGACPGPGPGPGPSRPDSGPNTSSPTTAKPTPRTTRMAAAGCSRFRPSLKPQPSFRPIAPGTTLLYRTARFRSRTGPRERNDGGPGRDLPQTKTWRSRQRPPTDENTKAPAAAAAEGLHGGGLRKRVSVRGSPQRAEERGGSARGLRQRPVRPL